MLMPQVYCLMNSFGVAMRRNVYYGRMISAPTGRVAIAYCVIPKTHKKENTRTTVYGGSRAAAIVVSGVSAKRRK